MRSSPRLQSVSSSPSSSSMATPSVEAPLPWSSRRRCGCSPEPADGAFRPATLSVVGRVRLRGVGLQNGVLVHGPTSWGCAVREPDGTLRVASGRKPRFADAVRAPVRGGPLKLAEAFAVLPVVRKSLPQARFAFERPAVLGSIIASSLAARTLRRSRLLPAGRRGVAAGAVSLIPAALALRGP